MIQGLTQVPWERVDVSFHKSRQRYVAHNTIQASSFTGWLCLNLYNLFFFAYNQLMMLNIPCGCGAYWKDRSIQI